MKIAKIVCLASCCLIFIQDSKAQTIDFSTTTTAGWTVTAGGATNATPYPFGNELSISSTGTGIGSFVSGGSWSAFDGFWTAQFTFFLPANALNVSLNFSGMYADDRVVLTLNGNTVGSAGIPYQGNATSGSMVLTDGGSLIPYTFDGASGTVSGAVSSGFILSGTNTPNLFRRVGAIFFAVNH